MSAHFSAAPLAEALGAVVTGLDLASDSSAAAQRALIDLLHARGVLVIKDQQLSEADSSASAGPGDVCWNSSSASTGTRNSRR